jgi:hypothetical protein
MPRAAVGLVFLLGAIGGVVNVAQAQVTDFHCSPVGGNAIRCTRLNQEPRRPAASSGWDSSLDRAQRSKERSNQQRHEMEMQKRPHEHELERQRKGSSAAPHGYPDRDPGFYQ